MDSGVVIRGAVLDDLDTIVGFNVAMGKETEDVELPLATAQEGVRAVLEGRTGAAYYVLEAPCPSVQGNGDGEAAYPPPASEGGEQQPNGTAAACGACGPAARRQVVASLMITKEWSDWRACDIWWIQSVYVRPDARRHGHFKAMYGHVRREAAAAGAAGLRLYVDVDNTRAQQAYESMGMRSHYKVYEDLSTHY